MTFAFINKYTRVLEIHTFYWYYKLVDFIYSFRCIYEIKLIFFYQSNTPCKKQLRNLLEFFKLI